MATRFTADQFQGTQFSDAKEKAKFANHFVAFILSGFNRKKFTKWFYNRLSNTFNHIAHFDQEGFYSTWFSTVNKQRQFIEELRSHTAYGQPEHTFVDVERQLIRWANGEGKTAIDQVLAKSENAEKQATEAEAERLASLEGKDSQEFKVVAKSSNTGSFGHRQYIVVARDGSAYEILIIPSNLSLSMGQVINVPLCNGQPQWQKFYVECPRRLGDAPQATVEEIWK